MNSIKFSCRLGTTDPSASLGLEAWIDDNKFFDSDHVTQTQEISTDVTDDKGDHVLHLIMKNKTSSHTKLDAAGKIIEDARLIVDDVAFDGIKLGHMFTELAVYTHDFNGAGSETVEKFHGQMGCNGVVSLEFTTPIYLWLLEHM